MDVGYVAGEDGIVEVGAVEGPVCGAAQGGVYAKSRGEFPITEDFEDVGPEFRREGGEVGRCGDSGSGGSC